MAYRYPQTLTLLNAFSYFPLSLITILMKIIAVDQVGKFYKLDVKGSSTVSELVMRLMDELHDKKYQNGQKIVLALHGMLLDENEKISDLRLGPNDLLEVRGYYPVV